MTYISHKTQSSKFPPQLVQNLNGTFAHFFFKTRPNSIT